MESSRVDLACVTAITENVVHSWQYSTDLWGNEIEECPMSISDFFASIEHRLRLRHPDFEPVDISKRLRELLDIARPRRSEASDRSDEDSSRR
jgi:hypothetical protein